MPNARCIKTIETYQHTLKLHRATVEVPHVMRHHGHLTHVSGSLTEQMDAPLNHHHVT